MNEYIDRLIDLWSDILQNASLLFAQIKTHDHTHFSMLMDGVSDKNPNLKCDF